MPDNLRDDYYTVLNHVKQYGCLLAFASDRLKDDESIVIEAVKRDGWAIQFASDRLRNNKSIIQTAIEEDFLNNGHLLKYASCELKDNYDIALQAAKKRVTAITFASRRIQAIMLKSYHTRLAFEL